MVNVWYFKACKFCSKICPVTKQHSSHFTIGTKHIKLCNATTRKPAGQKYGQIKSRCNSTKLLKSYISFSGNVHNCCLWDKLQFTECITVSLFHTRSSRRRPWLSRASSFWVAVFIWLLHHNSNPPKRSVVAYFLNFLYLLKNIY